MKLKLLAIVFTFISSGILCQNVVIPSYEFKQVLLNYSPSIDINNDNQISFIEALAVTTLDVSYYQESIMNDPMDPFGGGGTIGISNFTGIEAFKNLTSLTCKQNDLTSLDVSALTKLTYLDCSSNINQMGSINNSGISSLILPNSGTLQTLIFNENYITSLDLTNQTALTNINGSSNSLTSINLTNTNALEVLNVNYNYSLTTLDLSNHINLNTLKADNCTLSNLNLNNTPQLKTLNCKQNLLVTLDTSTSIALQTLKCYQNKISSLDLTNNINLISVATNNNLLTNLQLPNTTTLTNLLCQNNKLTNLDTSIATELVTLNSSSNLLTNLTLPVTSTLLTIETTSNKLTTLNTTNVTGLITLKAFNNLLTSLTLPNSITLKTLEIHNNQLAVINLAPQTGLVTVNIGNNLLPLLDVSQNLSLQTLRCDNNQLASLNTLSNTSLNYLSCSNNLLTDINTTTTNTLTSLYCSGNLLTELDLSSFSNLSAIYCNNNLLTSLNLKNGNSNSLRYYSSIFSGTTTFNAKNNANLDAICVDDALVAAGNLTNGIDSHTNFTQYCSFVPVNSNTITGTISYDFNNDGCDATDTKSVNTRINSASTNVSASSFSSSDGSYTIYINDTDVNTEIIPNFPSFFSVTPNTKTTNFTGSGNTEVIDFCITANQVVNDVKITVIPTTEARPGFDTSVRVYYENIGSSTLSGTVDLAFPDNQLSFLNASIVPDAQTSTLLTWNYTNLLPFDKGYIDVIFNINTPVAATNPVNGGDLIVYTSNITSSDTDVNPTDNTSTFTEIVVNSYDPNDIVCFEGDYIDAIEVPNFLNYRVRFQNTGTASAINIVVKNELDVDLDWSTFTPVSASHNYRTSIEEGNKVEFIFENIHLADSLSNEPESHGWIFFKIKPKSTFSLSDVVENTSYIYFDYNAPIITNTATTQLTRIASLTTTTANNITQTSADLAGNISTNGGALVTERGIVYTITSNNGNPEIDGTDVIKLNNGTGIGTFSNSITNLIPNTQYSFKSYAINSAGINYGNLETFTTNALIVPTINFTDISKTYGDSDFLLSATSDSTGEIIYTIEGNANGTSIIGTNNNLVNIGDAATITIRATTTENNMYAHGSKDITLTINKANLTVTADSFSRIYGDANPTYTFQYSGFVNGEDVTILDEEPIISSVASQNSNIGSYDILFTNGADNNYSLIFINGNLSVSKRLISILADNITKSIGDSDPNLTYHITSGALVNGDVFTGNINRVSGETLGTYAIQKGTLFVSNNYLETFTEGIFTISSTAGLASDFLDQNLTIYPNPVRDILVIKVNNNIIVNKFSLYNVQGKIIKNVILKQKTNISNLPTGIYFIKIETDKGIGIKKIIKL